MFARSLGVSAAYARIWLRACLIAPTNCALIALLLAWSTRRRYLSGTETSRKLLTSSFLSPSTLRTCSSQLSLLVFQIAGRIGWTFPLVRNTQQLVSLGA